MLQNFTFLKERVRGFVKKWKIFRRFNQEQKAFLIKNDGRIVIFQCAFQKSQSDDTFYTKIFTKHCLCCTRAGFSPRRKGEKQGDFLILPMGRKIIVAMGRPDFPWGKVSGKRKPNSHAPQKKRGGDMTGSCKGLCRNSTRFLTTPPQRRLGHTTDGASFDFGTKSKWGRLAYTRTFAKEVFNDASCHLCLILA